MVKWQCQTDNGIITEKLPPRCEGIKLVDNGIVKISLVGPGEPFFFIRHFCSLNGPERLEYHIGIKQEGKIIEKSYDPTRGVGCTLETIN